MHACLVIDADLLDNFFGIELNPAVFHAPNYFRGKRWGTLHPKGGRMTLGLEVLGPSVQEETRS